MKYLTFLLIILTTQVQAQSIPLEKVEVFFEGARFTHSGSVELSQGKNELTISGISPKLLESSIAVQFGSNKVRIQQLELETTEAEVRADIKEQRDSLETMSTQLSLLEMEVEVLNQEKKLAFEALSRQGQTSMSDPTAAQNMLDFYRKRLLEIEKKVMDLDSKMEVQLRSHNELAAGLYEKESFIDLTKNLLKLTVESSISEEVEMDLYYETNGAGWAPEYVIQADLELSKVLLLYKVGIFNETGLDWQSVECLVSTAQIGMDRSRPSLEKWVIKASQDWGLEGRRFDNAVQSSNYQFKPIQVEEKIQDFPLEERVDLVADGKVEWFDLKAEDFNAEFRNFSIPKVNNTVFVEGGFTEWEDLELIPAEAKVYSGTKYIGETFLNPYSYNDTMWVAFGSNPQISVKRKRVEVDKSRSLLGRKIKEEFTFEISVKNRGSEPAAITIKDQVPVSEDENITVEIGDLSSASRNPSTGILTWRQRINANSSQTMQFSYIIEYPKGMSYSQVRKKLRTISAPSF